MRPEQFCYWLQGYFEISGAKALSEEQAKVVQDHLALVFTHVLDKEHDGGDPAKAKKLNQVHGGNVKFRC